MRVILIVFIVFTAGYVIYRADKWDRENYLDLDVMDYERKSEDLKGTHE